MPRILALPNEILLQVVENLSHGDLENFALTCKRILNLSWDEKKNTYGTITCGDVLTGSAARGLHLFNFLHDILLDDSIAVYTTELLIGAESVRDGGPEVCQILLGIEHEIDAVLSACPYLDCDQGNDFKQLIMTGDEDMTVALLITLLPNLLSIKMRGCSLWDYPILSQMFDNISESHSCKALARDWDSAARYVQQEARRKRDSMELSTAGTTTSASRRIDALDKVRDANIICETALTDFQWPSPFLSLPSMQSLSCRNFIIAGRLQRTHSPYSIANLDFQNISTDAICLGELLTNISSLRHFRYIESTFKGEPCDIIRILSLKQNRSLVSLTLTGNRYAVASRQWTGFVSYLKDFQTLKTISMDNTMLSKDYNKETENNVPGVPWRNVSSNVEYLPITVTSLTLAQPFAEGVGRELLQSLPKQKKEGLSGLTEVSFEHEPNLGADLEDALKDAGIELRFPNRA